MKYFSFCWKMTIISIFNFAIISRSLFLHCHFLTWIVYKWVNHLILFGHQWCYQITHQCVERIWIHHVYAKLCAHYIHACARTLFTSFQTLTSSPPLIRHLWIWYLCECMINIVWPEKVACDYLNWCWCTTWKSATARHAWVPCCHFWLTDSYNTIP